MAESLAALEGRRQELYQQLGALGDFRPGTISINYRKCGKTNCRCAQPGEAGHGPQYLWTTTRQGKGRAQNLHWGAELEKAHREVANYERFKAWCEQLVAINEQICLARPVPAGAAAGAEPEKKTLRPRSSRKSGRK